MVCQESESVEGTMDDSSSVNFLGQSIKSQQTCDNNYNHMSSTENGYNLANDNNYNNVTEKNNMLEANSFELFDEIKPAELEPPVKRRSRWLLGTLLAVLVGLILTLGVTLLVLFLRSGQGENHSTVIPPTVLPTKISPTPTITLPNSTDSYTSLHPSPSSTVSISSSTLSPTPSSSVSSVTSTVSVSASVSTSISPSPTTSVSPSSSVATEPSTSFHIVTTPISVCDENEFRCASGLCIPLAGVCDGNVSCPAGDDELNCPCGQNEWKCNSGECIRLNDRCDMTAQCKDKSDEMNCSNCEGFQCKSGLCLWTQQVRCNGIVDCMDLSDETSCYTKPGYRKCANGMSIKRSKFCDNVDDCFDNSDETDKECTQGSCDPIFERPCRSGGCYIYTWHCDGHSDCSDGSDEENCPVCSDDQFQCLDYKCIGAGQVCDGVQHCRAGEDEIDCIQMRNGLSGPLTLKSGDLQLPVCSDTWTQDIADGVCQHLGHGTSSKSSFIPASNVGINDHNGFMIAQENLRLADNQTILAQFVKSSACPSQKIVSLTCQPEVCGKRQVEMLSPYIHGGSLSPLGKWPWVVSLSLMGDNICGGAIIDHRWILTAAHCIVQQDTNYTSKPWMFEVMAGTVSRDRNTPQAYQRVRVDGIVLNPNLKKINQGTFQWDMALMHLSVPLVYGDNVQPICMVEEEGDPDVLYSQCYLAGWGFINNNEVSVLDQREGKMSLYTEEACGRVASDTPIFTNSTVCAGYPFGIISGCKGDSGSPLMCVNTRGDWSVVGLMSYGGDRCNGINRFAKISTSMDWIKRITNS